MESTNGRIIVCTKETGNRTKFLVTASTLGMMAGSTRGTGKIIICMVRVFICGPMVGNMKVST